MKSCVYCKLAETGYRDDVHETPVGLRERKKQRTREQIAGAALELFSDRGYHATTVADIAAAADVSERTVFGYFATKEDILFADHLALEQGLAEALEHRSDGHALDTLREFLVDNLSRFDEQARIRWQIVRHDELLLAHQRARQAAFGEVIARAIAQELGERVDDLRPQLVTAAVIAAFTATYEHRYRARSQSASRAQAIAVIDEAIVFLRGGLEAIKAFPKPY
jgi:AcrR family transcriptional regulator